MTVRIPSPYGNMAGAPQELMAAYLRDPRLAMAQRSLQEGSSTAPLQGGWMEGLARLGQGLWGGYQQGQVGREYEDQSKAYRETLAAALRAKTPQEREAILGGNSLTAGNALEQAMRRQEKQADRDADLQARMLAQGLRYDPATQSFDEAGNFADIMANRKTQELDTEYGAKLKYQPKFDELALAVADKEAAIRAKYERQLIGARTAAEAGLIAQRRDAEIAANRAKLQDEQSIVGAADFGSGVEGKSLAAVYSLAPVVQSGQATPEQLRLYGLAYSQVYGPKTTFDIATGQPKTIVNEPPPGIPSPAGGQQFSGDQIQMPGSRVYVGEPTRMTAEQGKVATFSDRMTLSDEVLRQNETALLDPAQHAAKAVPYGGNYLVSPEFQQADQAQRDFVNAVLRRESGAVISDEEFDNARKQYLPQPGDSAPVLEQKRRNRRTVIEGFAREAGGAYKPPKAGQTTSSDFAGKVKMMSSDAIRAMDVDALSAENAQAVLGEIQRRKQTGAW